MRRAQRRSKSELEDGWNSDFAGSKKIEKKERADLDVDLLQMQASWCTDATRAKTPFGFHSRMPLDDDEDEDINGAEFLGRNEGDRVKSGAVNRDAPLFLKALDQFGQSPPSRAPTPSSASLSISRYAHPRTTARTSRDPPAKRVPRTEAKAAGRKSKNLAEAREKDHRYSTDLEEASFWASWQQKWDFVYDFVDAEKAKIEAEKKARNRGLVILKARGGNSGLGLQSNTPGLYPNFQSSTFARNPSGRPSSASRWSAKCEKESVGGLPDCSSSKPPPRNGFTESTPTLPAPAPGAPPPNVPATTWEYLDAKLAGEGELGLDDVPWPPPGRPIMELNTGNAKKILRTALLRWHPDKFQKIIARIEPAGKAEALVRVQEVARRIIAEKESAGL
jgi:hypothetical protein